jgi:hypothetical protein
MTVKGIKGARSILSLVLSVSLVLTCFVPAQVSAISDVDLWKADIMKMKSTIDSVYFSGRGKISITKEDFAKSCNDIIGKLPKLSEQDTVLEMMKTIALLGDAHANLSYAKFRNYPFYLYWLDDGLYLVTTTVGHMSVLKKRLTKVAGMPIDDVIGKIHPFISHDNEYWIRHVIWNYITNPDLLKYAGVAKSADECEFTFEDDAGRQETVKSMPITISRDTKWIGDPTYEKKMEENPPLYYQGRYNYFFQAIPESNVMYVNYKRCVENKDYSFITFFEEMKKEWNAKKPTKLVLDIRFNSGGSTMILMPLISWVKKVENLNKPENFYVITGRRTFSAASQNAAQLYTQTKATFVGEPIGQKPNHWGQVQNLVLDKTKIQLYLSSKYMVMMSDSDPDTIMPDTSIPWNHNDYFDGKDTILDAILAGQVPPNLRHYESPQDRIDVLTEELNRLQAELMIKFPDFSKTLTTKKFIDKINEVKAKIKTSNDYDLVFEISKALRIFKNSKLTINCDALTNSNYLLGARFIGDGVYAVVSNKSNKKIVGKKLIAIGDTPIDRMAEKFAQYFYFDDWNTFVSDNPKMFANDRLLLKLGIIKDTNNIAITVEGSDGKRENITLARYKSEDLVILPDYSVTPKPIYRKNNQGLWNYYIEDRKTLYVSMFDPEIADIEQFSADFFKNLESMDIKKIVFDYRSNFNSIVPGFTDAYLPFYQKLEEFINNNEDRYKFFAITERQTSDFGVFHAAYLKKRCKVKIVGETPAIKPSKIFSLAYAQMPYLKMNLNIPTRQFQSLGYLEDELLVPDKEIVLTGKHYFCGVDPVMDWILGEK